MRRRKSSNSIPRQRAKKAGAVLAWRKPTRLCSGIMAQSTSIPWWEQARHSACACLQRWRDPIAARMKRSPPEPASGYQEPAEMKALLLLAAVLTGGLPFLAANAQSPPDSGAPDSGAQGSGKSGSSKSGSGKSEKVGYLGFDRNQYPGDVNLKILRQSFSYSGYWLNNPPGAKANSWKGKRQALEDAGFGFLVLFNGRTYAEIKHAGNATKLGTSDAAAAIAAARAEGLPPHTVIFLDQEQGGRLLPEQRAYLHAWVDAVSSASFVAGIYCSGIAAKEGSGESVITAQDIRTNAGNRKIKFWVVNDSCPPSPGCTVSVSKRDLMPESSGTEFSDVWQFAQSPKRRNFAKGCPANYNKDGNCYANDSAERLHVDLNVATSSDPSHGRTGD